MVNNFASLLFMDRFDQMFLSRVPPPEWDEWEDELVAEGVHVTRQSTWPSEKHAERARLRALRAQRELDAVRARQRD